MAPVTCSENCGSRLMVQHGPVGARFLSFSSHCSPARNARSSITLEPVVAVLVLGNAASVSARPRAPCRRPRSSPLARRRTCACRRGRVLFAAVLRVRVAMEEPMRWGLRPQPEPREITREEVASYQRDRLVFALACSLAAGRTGFHEEAPTQEDYEQAEALVRLRAHPRAHPNPLTRRRLGTLFQAHSEVSNASAACEWSSCLGFFDHSPVSGCTSYV
jgi:hypothetical protein